MTTALLVIASLMLYLIVGFGIMVAFVRIAGELPLSFDHHFDPANRDQRGAFIGWMALWPFVAVCSLAYVTFQALSALVHLALRRALAEKG